MHILMADDDHDDYFILKEAALKVNEVLKVSYAPNWIDLWRNLLKGHPDVLFLDINMPVKDGFECLHVLRDDQKFDSLPIVIYSNSLNKTDIDKAYTLGANYFIIKPFSIEETVNILFRIYSMDKMTLLTLPSREDFVIT